MRLELAGRVDVRGGALLLSDAVVSGEADEAPA
jgi:hypothetical protein